MLSKGTKVKVINQAFANAWEKSGHRNVWIIDHIKPKVNKEPTLYVCVTPTGKTMYQFQEHELKEIETI